MSKVFFDVAVSIDGYIAGERRGPQKPLGEGGIALHQWMFKQKSFLRRLKLEGGETNNRDSDIIEETFSRIGANIMGMRMFEEGEANWPDEAPFATPVFVLTHLRREPWIRKGGTTFYFVTEQIETVLEKARQAAGSKDIRISGGANTIQQYLNAGLIDEFTIHHSSVLIGSGVKLFENVDKEKVNFEIAEVISSATITHIHYTVKNK